MHSARKFSVVFGTTIRIYEDKVISKVPSSSSYHRRTARSQQCSYVTFSPGEKRTYQLKCYSSFFLTIDFDIKEHPAALYTSVRRGDGVFEVKIAYSCLWRPLWYCLVRLRAESGQEDLGSLICMCERVACEIRLQMRSCNDLQIGPEWFHKCRLLGSQGQQFYSPAPHSPCFSKLHYRRRRGNMKCTMP